jgi:Mg-chelatase subunit ChlI
MLPFVALVGQEEGKLALTLAAVDPGIGGVLVSGVKGTGKSTIVRSFADVLPDVTSVDGCRFGCRPDAGRFVCADCARALADGSARIVDSRPRIVTVPLGVTEDMLLGTMSIEKLLSEGVEQFQPGLLAKANGQILYVDEVNLLPDSIADDILDASAMGFNTVEREGVSVTHPARFTLVGTMNPEEGQLRPQILDRFALSVSIGTLGDPAMRAEIVRRSLAYESRPVEFLEAWSAATIEYRRLISAARTRLASVKLPAWVLDTVSGAMSALGVDGLRPDLVTVRAAMANAALRNAGEVEPADLAAVAPLAVCHRTRNGGFDQPPDRAAVSSAITDSFEKTVRVGGREGYFDPSAPVRRPE